MTHEQNMREALAFAIEAGRCGEVPVGCIITDDGGRIIASGRNRRESSGSAVAHAEIEAIENACRHLGGWRLSGCSLYVTLEPCPMCAGAILNARVSNLFFGARDENMGSCGSVINLFMERYGYSPRIVGGILEKECAALMTDFFRGIRKS